MTALSLLGTCERLRVLRIGISAEVTDSGCESLGCCSALEDVDLYRCAQVTDTGMAAIARGCPRLRQANLSYCARLTDAAFRALAGCRALQNLEVRGLQGLTSEGLAALAEGCTRITEMDVKRCTGLGDAGLVAVARLCPSLRQVNLSYSNVGNAGLAALARLPGINKLNLVQCKAMTIDCIVASLLAAAALRKVKLLAAMKIYFPPSAIETLENRGVALRWMNKPP
eukprot:SM000015S01180  [mRNA]  locus=s15:239146:240404:+ [translate_table: standard]